MSTTRCPVCGREANDGWSLCPQCGSELRRPPGETVGRAALTNQPEAATDRPVTETKRSPSAGDRPHTPGSLTIAARLGAVCGLFVALLIGLFFVYAASSAPITDYALAAFLAVAGVIPLVLCAILGLAAFLSDFFPALAAMFSEVSGLAALLSLFISAYRWNGAGAVVAAAWLVEFALCYFILRAISPRMSRRRRHKGRVSPEIARNNATSGYAHYLFGGILDSV
jgi:hypothetical protein